MGLDIYSSHTPEPVYPEGADDDARDEILDAWYEDMSHVCQTSYSGFHSFRVTVASAENIPLNQMAGFGAPLAEEVPSEFFDGFGSLHYDVPWERVDTPLEPFLRHSDCDGSMTPEECAQVAPRLREIVESWDEDFWRKSFGLDLVDGMERAAIEGLTLVFM